jgi:NHLM bacteriocin system ABC transporter ATP-binding protein
MSDRTLQIIKDADATPLGANNPIVLNMPKRAWLVQDGYVDLFAVAIQGDRLGRRHFLTRVHRGGLVFGLPADTAMRAGNMAYSVLAVGGLGTWVLTLEDGSQLARLPLAQLAPLVDDWACSLADTFAETSPIWPEQIAPETGEIKLAPKQRLYGHARHLVWLESKPGNLVFMERPLAGPDPVPVMGKTWVRAIVPTELVCRSTAALAAQKRLWPCLDAYHHLALALISTTLETKERELAERSSDRETATRASVETGFAKLAEVVHGVRQCGFAGLPAADPLLAACQHVGEVLGIQIRAPNPNQDPNADALTRIVQASHLRSRRVTLRARWWTKDNGPLIAYDKNNSPIALIPERRNRYRLIDAATGKQTRVDEDIAMNLKSEAFVLYRKLPERALSLLDVIRVGLRGMAQDTRMVAYMGIAGGLLALVTPIAIGMLAEQIIPRAALNQLWQLVAALGVAILAMAGFQFTQAIALLRLQGRMDWHLQAALFDRLLRLPPNFFKEFSTGDLGHRVLAIQTIRQTLSASTTSSFIGVLFSVFSLVLLFFYSWKLALLAVATVAISVPVTMTLSLLQLREERERIRNMGKVEGLVLQLLVGISKLRVAAAEPRALAAWSKEYVEQKQRFVSAQRFANAQEVFQSMFMPLATLMVFLGVVWLLENTQESMKLSALAGASVLSQRIGVGDFIASIAAFGQFLAAMTSMTLALTSVLNIIPLYERAQPLLQAAPETGEEKNFPGRFKGEIEFSEVTFRYFSEGPPVIDRLSLRIESGAFLAIVGPSGSGKSTLLRLLLGFEIPERGGIFFDGKSLSTLDKEAVRRQIGVVMQNGRLLAGSIFHNIVGASRLSIDAAWYAARLVGLAEDIEAMPMGMHTVLSESAGALSGGQRQRLMIARALVNQPQVLFLDEATSALDNRAQAIVAETLTKLNTTRVVIAHRLSTIRQAKRIIVLEHGRMVQSGNFDELMADKAGPFNRLVHRQLL